MPRIRTFTVKPSLPEPLRDLREIAMNLYWAWNSDVIDLFRRIDAKLWHTCGHNPVKLLGSVSQAKLAELAENEGFLYQLKQAKEKLDATLESSCWFDRVQTKSDRPLIAYFSAEYGLHESMPIYSGGLGVLAGDHLKSASDLGIPLVAIGLMYQKGYFRQYLNSDGWQQEHLVENELHSMPIELLRKRSKRTLKVSIPFPQKSVRAQVWCASVGRVKLYLLDTNVTENSEADRIITEQLYGGDSEMRIQQEIVLGIGGMKVLKALGLEPTVCHMNEGHAAFMSLERVRRLRSTHHMSFEEAVEAARSSNIFTVHTPVAAGNDEFDLELMDKYFGHYFSKLGINRKQFLALGRIDPENEKEKFKMPVLALRMSSYRNGVSQLHGQVSRKMWSALWPEVPQEEVPIQAITNGVHARTWVSAELSSLYERYLGANWGDESVNKAIWQNMDLIPDEELWRIHQRCKERLVAFTRKRLSDQMRRRGSFHTELGRAEEVLDPEALTIGFARRFATYKRGNLLLKYPDRLLALLRNTERPIQFVFAGKAHPRDAEGKDIIRQIVHFASQQHIARRVVFVEDYDINVARHLVQGVDVWLNNPRRPLEASGTSGMKAALNGILNLSTLDGWWCEGYTNDGGWVIGAGEEYSDVEYGDAIEAQALFNLLENEVVPLFYARSSDRLPRAWIRRMKNTIKWCAPRFNTGRMVAEYTRKFYNPAAARWEKLSSEGMKRVRDLTQWKANLEQAWDELAIESVDVQVSDQTGVSELDTKQPELEVGGQLSVSAKIRLGKLKPDDVAVQIFQGRVDSSGTIREGEAIPMDFSCNGSPEGFSTFTGTIPCRVAGQQGFAVRILPQHEDLGDPYEPRLIVWESSPE